MNIRVFCDVAPFRLVDSYRRFIFGVKKLKRLLYPSGLPRNFFSGDSTNSIEDKGQRDRGSGGGKGSGGNCNLVQEISFHIVKFSAFLLL